MYVMISCYCLVYMYTCTCTCVPTWCICGDWRRPVCTYCLSPRLSPSHHSSPSPPPSLTHTTVLHPLSRLDTWLEAPPPHPLHSPTNPSPPVTRKWVTPSHHPLFVWEREKSLTASHLLVHTCTCMYLHVHVVVMYNYILYVMMSAVTGWSVHVHEYASKKKLFSCVVTSFSMPPATHSHNSLTTLWQLSDNSQPECSDNSLTTLWQQSMVIKQLLQRLQALYIWPTYMYHCTKVLIVLST